MTSDEREGDDRHQHSRLTEREDAEQRGEDPPDSVGAPEPTVEEVPNPEWQPDPSVADRWQGLIAEWGREHRPNREDVLPYLLIRAFAPGDRGQRPIWPPQPSWLSPDIALIDDDWTGPFDTARVVASPTAGRSYRVFVHVWNLGLLPAVGAHVRAWHVSPGFFGGQPGYAPTLIGGAYLDLAARTAPGAHRLAEVQPPWSIPPELTGHECLLASIECPADRWSGTLDANADRHVGQRNLTILGPTASLGPLLGHLGEALRGGEFLEVTLAHGEEGIRYGVPIAGGQHLFVCGRADERLLIVPTARLTERLGDRPSDLSVPGTAAALLAESWSRFVRRFRSDSLNEAFTEMLDARELTVTQCLQAFALKSGCTVHLSAFDRELNPVGGYSIALHPELRVQG